MSKKSFLITFQKYFSSLKTINYFITNFLTMQRTRERVVKKINQYMMTGFILVENVGGVMEFEKERKIIKS